MKHFHYFLVFENLQVQSDAGLFVQRLVFSFNLMVVSTRSSSLPKPAPGKDVMFTLLMLDLKRWDIRMKSICTTCPIEAWQVAVLDNLLG